MRAVVRPGVTMTRVMMPLRMTLHAGGSRCAQKKSGCGEEQNSPQYVFHSKSPKT
jgi:hypothetical protein